MTRFAVAVSALSLALMMAHSAAGQSRPPAPSKAPPAAKQAAKESATSAEPATVEQATRVLDLRTFPLMDGAKVSSRRSLGMLRYEAQGTTKAAFEFQQRELTKRAFKELPGGYASPQTYVGNFSKEGFIVAVSASEQSGDPAKAGWSSVTLVNNGNVALDKLPTPPGVKPFHSSPTQAAYTTTAKPAEAAAACRKLLLAAGWEPYGQADHQEKEQFYGMQYFKRNAIKLMSWVSTTPAEGGKTLVRYDTELMSVDLPAPPDAADPRYDDYNKKIDFAAPKDQIAAIFAFYQDRLPKQGWKATTEKPIYDDSRKLHFLIFRNAQKDLLGLDLKEYNDKVDVRLSHQTETELAEEERRLKEEAEKLRLAEELRNRKINVAVPLPAGAGNIDKSEANLFEFEMATGSGPATLEAFRTHFKKDGWTEEAGVKFERNAGEVNFSKGLARISLSYFDIGFGSLELRVSGTKNVVFEPVASKEKPAAAPTAKAKTPVIPGLPALPPGVEIPADVEALLKKALEDAGKAVPKKK